MRMNSQAPPTLLELAQQNLLREEALPISALIYLPRELFPPVFVEAFTKRQTDVLRAMVQAWPFPCLPLGALMKSPDLEILQAVLDGVDLLINIKVRPRRWKLAVLDLRNVHHNFWNTWAGMKESGSSAQVVSENQLVQDSPRYPSRRHLKVLADLCLTFHLDEYHRKFLHWAQQRRRSLKFCCMKLQMWALPIHTVREVLTVFQPQHLQELELNTGWNLSTLVHFAVYYLSKMRNLRKLFLAQIDNTFSSVTASRQPEKECVAKFISQFSRLTSLQHLYIDGVTFLRDHMQQLFRSLKCSLETLSITLCQVSQSDLSSLSQCQSLSQLKHLNLRGVELFRLSPLPLQDFLKSVSDTLQTLELEHCRMGDSHVSTLLPALSQCCQLTTINFYDNDISIPVLNDLLHYTTNLSHLTLELYPAPLECYDDTGDVLPERFAQLCAQLMDALRVIRQPKTVSFATYTCRECSECCVYDLETRFCLCWR